MVTMPEDSVVVGCAGPGNGKRCPAKLAMTHDELREINDAGGSVRCPGCERKKKEGERKAAGRTTVLDTILLAAFDIETADGLGTMLRVNDLVVAAWSLDRAKLGLKGFERQYPDKNRVLMDVVKMVKAGLLERPAPSVYRLTEAGRKRAGVLANRRKSA